MDDESRNWGSAAVVIVIVVVVLFGSLLVFGGQTSSILSNVGSAIGPPPEGNGAALDPEAAPVDEGKGQIADAGAAAPELLIIRTGELQIEVADLAVAMKGARTRVLAVGGYVDASAESATSDTASASAVYRIPADRWDEALEGIRGLATKVRQLQVGTEAVTGQVVDLGARVANLRVSEAALQKIMAQATKITDVLSVQAELTKVREDIERLVAEKALLEERAAFGTLAVTYSLPETPATEEARRGWDPAADADRATGTLIGVGQAGLSVAIWLGIVGLPLVLIAAIVVALGLRIGRFVSRRGMVEPGPS
jgi:exosome complex RNA-binding protein Csl4